MLRALCLSLIFCLSAIPGWTVEPVANPPQGSEAQSAATASQADTPQTSPPAAASAELSATHDLLQEAIRFYRKGDLEHAIQKYTQLIQEKPNSPDAYAGLTRVYLKKKDVKQAFDTVNKGLQAADSPVVHVAFGEVLFRQGHIAQAEQEWAKVVNSGYQNARAYMGLARIRWAISMYKSGWSMIEKAHELDPTDPDISRRWVARLSRAEQIKYWEQYLAGENNDDAETLARIRYNLEYLKARAKDPRGACHLVSKVTTTETPLVRLMVDPTHLRGYGLTVEVNGKKSKLLLDTGASGIIINRNLATKADVTNLSHTEIGGIGDKSNQSAYMGLVNSLGIGELEFQNCAVEVLERRSVTGEDGLIGADVFSAFLVDIDFPKEKLRLRELPKRPGEAAANIALQTERAESGSGGEAPASKAAGEKSAATPQPTRPGPQDSYIAPEMTAYTRVYRFGHTLLVPTSIGDAPLKLFAVDTGGINSISPGAAAEVTKVSGDSFAIVKGLSGSVKNVYRADQAVVQFGHLRQQIQGLLTFDLTHLSDLIGTEVSGVLGFTTLRNLDLKLDYRDGIVDFQYDAKR